MNPRIIMCYLSARPHKIKEALSNLFSTVNSEICVYLLYSGKAVDIEETANLKILHLGPQDPPNTNVTELTNTGLKQAIAHYQAQDTDLVGMWCDDLVGQPNWGVELVKAYKNNHAKDFIAVNDCNYQEDYIHSMWYHSPIFFTTKKYLVDVNNGSCVPECYVRFFCDTDNSQVAKLLDRFQFADKVVIRHMHYTAGTREPDELDVTARKKEYIDYEVYKGRRQLLFKFMVDPEYSTFDPKWKETGIAYELQQFTDNKITNIIEIGTFVGSKTIFLSKLFPELKIDTIDVSPYACQDAQERFLNFPNITIHHGFSISFGECFTKLNHSEKIINRYLRYNNLGMNKTKVLNQLLEKSERPLIVLNSKLTTQLDLEKVITHCDTHKKPFVFLAGRQWLQIEEKIRNTKLLGHCRMGAKSYAS